ncbi:hypothetical protein [Streptomyces albicerus]|uniref:hypothetical protein n=1 Tax=Streptomyces albicerus TaxID=2569859 RepID=UPI00124B8ED6|nr:hypothetical protein [Streptomyces albicerus]
MDSDITGKWFTGKRETMALNSSAILDAVATHAMSLGHFQSVTLHEPRAVTGNGIAACVLVESITPIRSSGAAMTSVRLELMVGIYTTTLTDADTDSIDAVLGEAADALMETYTEDFTLGGLVRQVDIFGAYGQALGARAGNYIRPDGSPPLRVFRVTLPLIVDDVFAQAA